MEKLSALEDLNDIYNNRSKENEKRLLDYEQRQKKKKRLL